jgi:(4-(4-[2-(gamma-L-glutamylamino)ethyl]phenoxymethyl)furan-2-yl)methanamine synthase
LNSGFWILLLCEGDDVACILGWDIGGANIKAAWIETGSDPNDQEKVVSQPFEIWREKDRLPDVLRRMSAAMAPNQCANAMAITITAELSDVFATKREGVLFVLDSIQQCFPDVTSYVLSLSGGFQFLSEARLHPLDFAATNWLASAQYVAKQFPNCLVVDVGSTTTDILPILNGQVCVSGRTDTARLASGELVFTGVLRTNLAAMVQSIPVAGQSCRVASEYFAVSGDVHLILGNLSPQEYTCPAPDGRSPSIESARGRLARLVCADTEMLSTAEIDEMARYIAERQVCQIQDAMEQVISRLPELRNYPVILLGAGVIQGGAAAWSLHLEIGTLRDKWGQEKLTVAPCLAAAYLLAEHLSVSMQ